jgi:RNA polymerase sigma-70 factor (ECF subfamily)
LDHHDDVTERARTDRFADAELARRCIAGDELARRTLFDAHRRRVHHVLFRVMGSNRDIDDAIQEAFLEIFRSLAIYRGESLLSTWIDRITVRVGVRVLRARPRDRIVLHEVFAIEDAGRAPDRQAEAREAGRRLYAILDDVDPVHRTAFVLHAIDGRPLRDVASVMGASVIATKLRVWRTRQRVEASARRDELLRSYLDTSPEKIASAAMGGDP